MEFDETPKFWYPRVGLVAWTDFTSRTVRIRPSERRKNLHFLFSPFLPLLPLFSFSFFYPICLSPLSFCFPPFLLPFTPPNWSQKWGSFPPLSSLLSPPHTCLICIFSLIFFLFFYYWSSFFLFFLFFFSFVLSHRIIFCLSHSNCFLIFIFHFLYYSI